MKGKAGWESRERSRRRRGRLPAKLGLLLGAVVATLVGYELVLRAVGARPQTATVMSSYFRYSPATGWIGRPDAASQLSTASFDVWITHDAEGFRNCGLETASEADAEYEGQVVWCVGDSFTWGLGVEDHQTFVWRLNRMGSDRTRFRNLGLPGFSSLQEYLLLKERFEQGHKPDRVLVLFCHNDLQDNLEPTYGRPYVEIVDGKPELRNCPAARCDRRAFRSWLKNHSLAYNHLNYYLMRIKQGRRQDAEPRHGETDAVGRRDHERLALRLAYAKMKQLCDEHGVHLAVATEYAADDRDPVRKESRQILLGACRGLSIPVLDLSKRWGRYLASCDDPEPLVFHRDPHYTATGHRLLAEGIREELGRLAADRATSSPLAALSRILTGGGKLR